ncbi:MAG: hypothetical protein V3U92_12300 [Cellulophaga sp.]
MLKNLFISFLFLFIIISVNSQTTIGEKELYKWFDTTIGHENTGLIDGLEYHDIYKTRNGNHKFYLSSSYQIGNISYNGQRYFDVEMKYDILDDQIIIKIPTQTKSYIIQLIKEKIDSFSIKDSKFISIDNLTNHNDGFYEVIYKSSNLAFYKKNIKTSYKHYSGRSIVYSFKNKDEYLLYFKSKYYKSKKSKNFLIKLLPKYIKNINLFYKSQSELLNTNYAFFMKKLMTELNNTISKQ